MSPVLSNASVQEGCLVHLQPAVRPETSALHGYKAGTGTGGSWFGEKVLKAKHDSKGLRS